MVDRYTFGKIVIDGQTYTHDLIVSRDQVWRGWWREQGHRLSVADLEDVLGATPEVLVVGTGMVGRMHVPDETRQAIEKKGIDLRVLPTSQAWKLYNDLEAGGRKVVAALHLTC
jgi:hypothetical protein